jgi:RNA polymerase sigma factor (TIGR02999 family)
MGESQADITMLLRAAASGQREDLDALLVAIYGDLRRLAASHLQHERADHTLQPTALVHEAYVRLIDQHSTTWKDRLHFFAIAAQAIRRILIDHARERAASKRGGGAQRLPIDEQVAAPAVNHDLLALDQALQDLAALDERQARVIELRFFGGCTLEETAEILGLTRRTVDRDWQAARAWLYDRLGSAGGATHG